MKPNEIQEITDVCTGLLHCLSMAKSPTAQAHILKAIRCSLDRLDSPKNKYRDIYETDGKVPAISEFRRLENCSLVDAKNAIEAMALEGNWTRPNI